MPARSLMFQGTGSDVGKSVLVAGLCRAYKNRGLKVLPFKPQNMSNNAAVTKGGGEIGRAQWLQALAAGADPSIHMNPVLLKPESDTGAQIVVHGKVIAKAEASAYQRLKPQLLSAVMGSFDHLKADADLVLVEGAGSPAEVNLRSGDIANMGFALPSQTPVVLIGDINRGGVIASIVGTHALLPEEEQALVKGVIINQFRGDISLFDGGVQRIETDTGWQSFGTVPFLRCIRELPAEDAVVLEVPERTTKTYFKIAVPLLPRIANFDDLDPLRSETGIDVVFCPPGTPLPRDADLMVLPGSKATIQDLRFLKTEGWAVDILAHARAGGAVLGLCGGYQMLGRYVADPDGVEGAADSEEGLGLLDVETVLRPQKITQQCVAEVPLFNCLAKGYEIHAGDTNANGPRHVFLSVDGRVVGDAAIDKPIYGTYLHGLFESGIFRRKFLAELGVGSSAESHQARVDRSLDELAVALEDHLNLDQMLDQAQ